MVFAEEVEDEAAAVVEDFEAVLEEGPTAHWPFKQVKPFGQQLPLQVSNVPDKSVEKSWLSGCRVAFCWVISQLMAVMVEQLWPVGQQIADFLLLKGTHVLVVGQQKLSGNPSILHGEKPAREHLLALGRSPIACAASSVIDSAVAEGMEVESRHSAVSLRRIIRPMMILYDGIDMEGKL